MLPRVTWKFWNYLMVALVSVGLSETNTETMLNFDNQPKPPILDNRKSESNPVSVSLVT